MILREKQRFSCYIIGEESLTIQCAEIIIKRGHSLLGIISINLDIKKWANEREICYIESEKGFEKILLSTKFDYLFSIVNPHILPQKILKQPRYLAINYHDALLPRYAGVHATSWSILNDEKTHGVTWHVMTEKIDGGDILKQSIVSIDKKETALSLNVKCYQAAMTSFSELIPEIEENIYKGVPQSQNSRTYYGLYQKPEGNGWINWNKTALEIERLIRALDFGHYTNTFSVPKTIINGQILIIKRVEVLKKSSHKMPGTIVKIRLSGIQVATKTNDILVESMSTMAGDVENIKTFCKFHKIVEEQVIFSPSKSLEENFKQISEKNSAFEFFWLNECRKIKLFSIPFLDKSLKVNSLNHFVKVISFSISQPKLDAVMTGCNFCGKPFHISLTLWLIYLYRLNFDKKNGCFITYPTLKKQRKFADFFSNIYPFVIDIGDDMSFKELLLETMKRTLQILDKGSYLKDISLRYGELNSLSTPDFLVLVSSKKKVISLPCYIKMLVRIHPNGQFVEISIKRNISNNYLKIAMKNAKNHLLRLFEEIIQNNDCPIKSLSFMSEKEIKQVNDIWNNTSVDYPRDQSVSELFETQVLKTPNNIALQSDDTVFSYFDLNEAVNRLVDILDKKRVGFENTVGILMNRCPEMIIGMLAILKLGKPYVPLDPLYPNERIQYILKNSGTKFVLTHYKLFKKATELICNKERVIIVDSCSIYTSEVLKHSFRSVNKTSDLACIMYTSGSLGAPKGVKVLHQGIVRLVKKTNYIDIQPTHTIAHISNPAFDASLFEIWGALLNGAKLVIFPRDLLFNAVLFLNKLKKEGVNILFLTTSFFTQLVEILSGFNEQLQYLLVGGDLLYQEAIKRYFTLNNLPNKLINVYGPTENTTFTTYYDIKGCNKYLSSVPIGKPISNTKVYVLDRNRCLLPMGAIGEIYITGDGVADGYVNNLLLTQELFVMNRGVGQQSCSMYKTGDLARWLPDGSLEFIRRVDNQIKIRGFRVELKEIEATLSNHPHVAQNAVVLFEDKHIKQKQLVAFVVKRALGFINSNKKIMDSRKFKEYLKEYLPDYMIPSIFYEIKQLPLTSNGKIDTALLNQYCNNLSVNNTKEQFVTPIQTTLKNIWKETFKCPVHLNDDFFDLGGDSIIAMQIIAKAWQKNISIALEDIFDYPTITQLSNHIEEGKMKTSKQLNLSSFIPFVPIQNWFFEQNLLKQKYFSQACLVNIKVKVDFDLLNEALNAILIRYDAFKIAFTHCLGEWKQHYLIRRPAISIEKILFQMPHEGNFEEFVLTVVNNIQGNFDFEAGVLFRAVLIVSPHLPSKYHLLMVAHHLIVDGVSWRIILEELSTFCLRKIKNHKKNLLVSCTFQEWSHALLKYSQGDHLSIISRRLSLAAQEVFNIPVDKNLGLNTEKNSDVLESCLNLKEFMALNKVARSLRVNIDELLLSVLARILKNWTKAERVLIDVESHGRENHLYGVDPTHTVGWFTSLFPLSLHWDESISVGDNIQSIKLQIRGSYLKKIDYGVLRYLSNKKGRLCLKTEICFNYWGRFDNILSEDSPFNLKWVKLISHPENYRSHLINVEAVFIDSVFKVRWIYSKNFHNQQTIQSLADNFIIGLRELCQYYFEINTDRFNVLKLAERPSLSIANGKSINHNQNHCYPLTPLQKGLFFHSTLSTNRGAYVVQVIFEAISPINIQLLRKSFDILASRHEVLRTCLQIEGVEPLQIVASKVSIPWYEYDWYDVAREEYAERLNAYLKTDRETGFALTEPPLLRVTVFKRFNDQYDIILTFHHIILDGWSVYLLFQELQVIYQSLYDNVSLHSAGTTPYASYVEWLRQQPLKKAEAFWKDYFKGFCQPTDLSAFQIERNHVTDVSVYEDILVDLPCSKKEQLYEFCRVNKITISTFILGIWGIVLHHYSQCEDVVFGVTASVRPAVIPQVEKIVGLMINTLPLRLKFDQDLPLKEYLLLIQGNMLELMRYSFTPLNDIHVWSGVSAHEELFKSVVAVENYPADKIDFLSAQEKRIHITDYTHYPCAFTVFPGEIFKLKFSYDVKKVTPSIAQRVSNHILVILNFILESPLAHLRDICILTTAEYHQTVFEWNPQIHPSYPEKTINQMFEEQAIKTPQRIALADGKKKITYQSLNEQANQLARLLQKKGVKQGTVVGICLQRCSEMIISILGILKSRAIYLPIDQLLPLERVKYILKDSDTTFLIAENKWIEKLAGLKLHPIVCMDIDTLMQDSVEQSICNMESVLPCAIAYIIYTSGSTGKPKGTLIEHRSVTSLFNSNQVIFSFNTHDRWTLFHSTSFDFSVWEMWGTLFYGGLLRIVSQSLTYSLEDFYQLLVDEKITILNLTPAVFYKIIRIDKLHHKKLSLRMVILGGEDISLALLKEWVDRHESIALINMYGITESTVHTTYYKIDKESFKYLHFSPIGKPLLDRTVYVLNKSLKPLPCNVVGELYISGRGVARSYLNSASLTKERFLDNPFHPFLPKMYKSGDFVKWRLDGSLEYIGRKDDQVKVRGFRIELKEIEATLLRYPGIEQAFVGMHENSLGNKLIVAYIVGESHLQSTLIREFIAHQLPSYMLPSSIIFIDSLPMTSNGKVDKKLLPNPETLIKEEHHVVMPVNQNQQILLNIWKKIIGINKISITDKFFDIGGDSLSALEMLSLIRSSFHVHFPLYMILEDQTIMGIEKKISLLQAEEGAFTAATQKNNGGQFAGCIVSLKSSGKKSPLFLIHPIGGTVFWYIPLTKYFDKNRPLYGIQDPGLIVKPIPFNSIQEMASFYIDAIQAVQPEGPYFLGGASAGATISIEIARQLLEKGEKISYIALLDGWAPFPNMLLHKEFFQMNMRRQYYLMQKEFLAKGIDSAETLLELQWGRSKLIAQYQVPLLKDVQFTLFKAIDTMDVFKSIDAVDNHWGQYSLLPVNIYRSPGDHESMFQEPNIPVLGKQLNESIALSEAMTGAI